MARVIAAADTKPSAASEPAKSSELDASLRQFSDPSFDPVDFLNDILPPLTRTSFQQSTTTATTREPGAVSLADLSAQTQTLLSQLSAQNARLSNTLTQLTDEILRGGGRLAYEVEVLRGETIGLGDTLTEVLHDDIQKFVPQGLDMEDPTSDPTSVSDEEGKERVTREETAAEDPKFITQLRTLSLVRARLEDVIGTFGEAMEWPLPPSEVSVASSFISVAGPEPGPENQSREEKGHEVAKKLRTEISELLDSEGGGEAGIAAASRRIEALHTISTVWKGTAEERARSKFVDSLTKMVEDKRKALEQARDKGQRDPRKGVVSQSARTSTDSSRGDRPTNQESSSTGSGLLRNLQRLRDEIYLE
ncbi:hypothetical protein AJ80_07343 [Polytolypa hystricis UAMH7299]|uniref:Uncharacterized protein n=1 Tax=Polytolypa hystricis (strain UAMH7299) TaxID=1447883 RepID=A0A2B7XPM4_POLH7|nr:hypothetical protein AJ80_07343 [Polytolypa hystricis UAMH7299]